MLPKYRFRILSDEDKPSGGAGSMVPIETSSAYLANERTLLPEDAVCFSQNSIYFIEVHHFYEIEIDGSLIFYFGQCTKIYTMACVHECDLVNLGENNKCNCYN